MLPSCVPRVPISRPPCARRWCLFPSRSHPGFAVSMPLRVLRPPIRVRNALKSAFYLRPAYGGLHARYRTSVTGDRLDALDATVRDRSAFYVTTPIFYPNAGTPPVLCVCDSGLECECSPAHRSPLHSRHGRYYCSARSTSQSRSTSIFLDWDG